MPRSPLDSVGVESRSDRSVPAQNDPGTPVRISTEVDGSSPAAAIVSMKSFNTAYVIAFFFSGRSMVIVPIRPSTS